MLIWSWVRQKKEAFIVVGLAIFASIIYSSFNWGLPERYNSPDEAANAYFAGQVAANESLTSIAPLNKVTIEPIVHPRSTHIVDGKLAPASFLGLPLVAGFVGRIFGSWSLPYVTAWGTILGLTFCYFLIRELFGQKAAIFTTLLLALLPPYWYYHARGFFHNALFFDFLLLAIWSAVKLLRTGKWHYYLLTGLACGAALAFRTSEFFWVTASGCLFLALSWHQIKFKYLWLIVLGAVIAFVPILVANVKIYGHLFSIGYRVGVFFPTGDLGTTTSLLGELILPFGFNLLAIGNTTAHYLWQLMPWWAVLAGVGAVVVIINRQIFTREHKNLALSLLVACLGLIVLYGSWEFNDNPDPSAITLGTSYARYWLPLYAFLLWPVGWTLARLWDLKWSRVAAVSLLIGYFIFSWQLVVLEPQEGLQQVRSNIKRFDYINKQVQSLTERQSVIVTDFITDKIFWPERQVIVSLEPAQNLEDIKKLLQAGTPVYRFHPTWPKVDFDYLAKRKLRPVGISIKPVVYNLDGYSLYRFTLKQP